MLSIVLGESVVRSFTKGADKDNIGLGRTKALMATEHGSLVMSIRRAKRDRWIYGICGGIAHHFGWNSNVVRAVVVFLAIFIPGISVIPAVLIYVLLGYLLPEAEEF
jgi:phage shock protein C